MTAYTFEQLVYRVELGSFCKYQPTFWVQALRDGDTIHVASDMELTIVQELCELPADTVYETVADSSFDWEVQLNGLVLANDPFKKIVHSAAVQCPFVPSSSMGRSYFVGVAVLFPVLVRVVLSLAKQHLCPPDGNPSFVYLCSVWSEVQPEESGGNEQATQNQIERVIGEAVNNINLVPIILDICSIVPFGASTSKGHLPLLYPRQIAFALSMGCQISCEALRLAGIPNAPIAPCVVHNEAVGWLRKVADYELQSLATETFATDTERKLLDVPTKIYRKLVYNTPLPEAKVLSQNPERLTHMTAMLAKLGIPFEVVKPFSIEEAQIRLRDLMSTTSKKSSIDRIKKTEASHLMSFLHMLSTVEKPTMVLEDDIEPYFSVEDTHMLIRSCMQLRDTVCFLEWCNGSNNICHSSNTRFGSSVVNGPKLRSIDNNHTRFYCTAAIMYTSAQAAHKFRLQIIDALREHGVSPTDIILNKAKPSVALVGPTFFQNNARFGSCIDAEICTTKHTLPPCWGFRRPDVASNIRLEFATPQSSQSRFEVPFQSLTALSTSPGSTPKDPKHNDVELQQAHQQNKKQPDSYNRAIVLVCTACCLGVLFLIVVVFRNH